MAETLPPLTSKDLALALKNPSFSVYLYIGKDTDKGWQVANAAFGVLPALRIYLVANRDLIQEWAGGPRTTGVVFGYGPVPNRFLTPPESEDLLVVVDAIKAARES